MSDFRILSGGFEKTLLASNMLYAEEDLRYISRILLASAAIHQIDSSDPLRKIFDSTCKTNRASQALPSRIPAVLSRPPRYVCRSQTAHSYAAPIVIRSEET